MSSWERNVPYEELVEWLDEQHEAGADINITASIESDLDRHQECEGERERLEHALWALGRNDYYIASFVDKILDGYDASYELGEVIDRQAERETAELQQIQEQKAEGGHPLRDAAREHELLRHQ
jgi:hypothetical protein